MKMTILALTAFVLAVVPLAPAQDETETPAPAPEATAPAPEQSESPATDPSVSVTTEKSEPTPPEKSSSPAPKKSSPSPGPTKASSPTKSSPTAPATKKTPSPAAIMPVKKSTPEATLREIENKWEASIAAHDPSVVQAYVANDYRGVSSTGKVINKAALLAQIKNDTDTYTSAKNGRLDVRVFDGRFAIVMGTSTEAGKAKDGKAFKRSFRWTDAWVERNGKWQCVASQAMALSK